MPITDFADSLLVRAAVPADVPSLFKLVMALADYEQLAHEVVGNTDLLHRHLFEDACIEAIVAEINGAAIGFALFFLNYSTVLMQPGIYLEDLFVLPQYRGQGIGKALFTHLAKLAVERNYGRLEWSVLDWNEPAIGFYRKIGAEIWDDVRTCRVTGDDLAQLAGLASFNLRPVSSADVAAAYALVQANIAHDGSLDHFQGNEATFAEHVLQQGYAEVLIAEDSQPVGLALFYKNYSTFLTQPGLCVEDLFVLPTYRGKGIGKSLLAALAQRVIDRNYGRLEWRVRVWNQPAVDFYQRVGAKILPDWRVCLLDRPAIDDLAASRM